MSEEGTVVESGPEVSGEASGNAEVTSPISFEGGCESDGGTENWRESLPEEYRESSWASKYESADEFYKGVDNMASLVGKKSEGINRPGEDATAEDWDAFYKDLGRPDEAGDYRFQLNEENAKWFQEGDTEAITNMFHEAGLMPEQGQKLLDAYMEWTGGKMENFQEALVENRADSEKALKGEWGADYDKNVATAQRGAKAAGVMEALEEAGLGNNQAVLKLAELAGRAVSEDSMHNGNQFSQAVSREQASRELSQITTDPNFRNDPVKSKRAGELAAMMEVKSDGDGGASVVIPSF